MRNRRLHDALRAFALDAARALSTDIDAGAEVDFELDERSTGHSVLYRYRPLIASFVSARWPQLRTLESFGPAAKELGTGSAAYLRVQGVAADADPEPALLAMLERIWEDATSFSFPEERFERVYNEVERALYEGVLQSSIVAPLPGLLMDRDRVDLADGISLVRGDLSGAPAEAVWPAGSSEIERGHVRPHVVALIEEELPADAALPLPEARWRLRRLVTALRLWRAGSVALPATGWARADDGPWRQIALQPAPPARGGAWTLRAEEEDGFREFAALVAQWEPAGPIRWALARFDMGCERGSDAEALSDYMLALRGVLDAIDEAGQPTLGRRLAALCAEEANRPLLQSRAEAAVLLEHALIAGMPIDAWSQPPGVPPARELVGEMEGHLRALLRDVACGYLKPELAAMADDILVQTARVHVAPMPEREPEHEPVAEHEPAVDAADGGEAPERDEPAPDGADQPEPAAAPTRKRGRVRAPLALAPPEGEPTVTRMPWADQPALVVDDFAWDLDNPDDYAAGV